MPFPLIVAVYSVEVWNKNFNHDFPVLISLYSVVVAVWLSIIIASNYACLKIVENHSGE